MEGAALKLGRYLIIGLLAGLSLCGGLSGRAHAAQLKLAPHPHYWFKKSHRLKVHKMKKLKNSKTRFRSSYSGNMLYGKPVKQK